MHPLPPTPQSSASPALSATHNAGPESTSTVQHLLDFSAPGKYWSQGPATRRGSSTSTPDASNLLTSASVASRPASKKRQRSQDASSSSNQAVTHRFFGGKQDGKKAAGISSPSMPKKGSVGSSPRRPAEPLSPLGPAAIFKAKMSTVGGNLAAGRSSYAGCIIILRYKNADCCSCGIYFHYTREADKLAAMHAHASTHLGADLWLVEANYGPRMRQDMEYLRTEYPDAAVMTFTKWDIPTTYHGPCNVAQQKTFFETAWAAETTQVQRKRHRYAPGTVALREIRRDTFLDRSEASGSSDSEGADDARIFRVKSTAYLGRAPLTPPVQITAIPPTSRGAPAGPVLPRQLASSMPASAEVPQASTSALAQHKPTSRSRPGLATTTQRPPVPGAPQAASGTGSVDNVKQEERIVELIEISDEEEDRIVGRPEDDDGDRQDEIARLVEQAK